MYNYSEYKSGDIPIITLHFLDFASNLIVSGRKKHKF